MLHRGLFRIPPCRTWTNFFILQITVNDLPVGRSVDETLRLLDAFQFTDKYDEVSSQMSRVLQDTTEVLTQYAGLSSKLEPRSGDHEGYS